MGDDCSEEAMRVLKNSKVDLEEWNEFVAAHPRGNVFQTAEVYEVYKRTNRYAAGLFVVVDDVGEVLAGLLAVVVWEPMLPFISARAVIKGGPLWVDKNALRLLMREYEKWASKRAVYSEIRNIFEASEIGVVLEGWKFEGELNFVSDLSVGNDALWNGLTKGRRNGVTKARRLGVVVREAEKVDLEVVYRLLKSTYGHARMPLADASFFEAAFDLLVSKGLAKFWLAEKEGCCVAVMFVTTFDGVIYDWYAGADGAFLRLCPNDLLAWNAIEWGAANEFKTFDFGGAGDPDRPYGVREFKRQFGGGAVSYGRFVRRHHPIFRRLGEWGFEWYRRFLG